MPPLVSVLIPTYNRAPLVTRAVNCGIKQTYPNIEVVVYDDGSTDATKEALRSFRKSKRLRYIAHPENRGPAPARNALLKHMKGEYACWLDSDDLCNFWRVELLMNAMLKWNPPFVRSAVSMYYDKNRMWAKKPPEVLYCKRQVVATALFRRDCAVPYDETMEAGGEDSIAEMDMVMKHGLGMVIPFNLYQIDRRKSYQWATRVSKWCRVQRPSMKKKVARAIPHYHAEYDKRMARMKELGLDAGLRAEYVPACLIDVPTGLKGPHAWCHGMRKVDWRNRARLKEPRLDMSTHSCPQCDAQRATE